VTADFAKIAVGGSVEGMGMVVPNLNIDGKGTAAKILPDTDPVVYFAPNATLATSNGNLLPGGGFSDVSTRNLGQAHLYTFTFAASTSVSNFTLHMLDYGDLNPSRSINHYVSMTAYNASGVVVGKQELQYTSSAEVSPHSSSIYGDLQVSGDANDAEPGEPGNWTWNVSGTRIVKVVLEFGAGFDPNIGFDTLKFTTSCP